MLSTVTQANTRYDTHTMLDQLEESLPPNQIGVGRGRCRTAPGDAGSQTATRFWIATTRLAKS